MAIGVPVERPGVDPRLLAAGLALAAPALGATAVVSPVAAAAAVGALAFVVLAFYDLAAGVALFTALTFLETLPAAGELGIVKAGGAILVLAALRRSGTPFLLRELPTLAFAAIFFAGWALASSVWAADVARAAGEGVRLLLDVLLVFVVFAAVRRRRDARLLVWGYIAGAAVGALAGVAGSPEAYGNRLAGGLGEPNFLAATLIPAFVFAVFAIGWASRSWQRWLLAGCASLFVVAIFLTQSRGGLFALGITFVVALVFGGSMRRYWVGLAVLAASVGIGYYAVFASEAALDRLANPGGGTGRADLWAVATDVIGDNPVVGVGAGNFPLVAPQYASEPMNLPSAHLVVDTPKVAHNTYIGVFADLGIVGLVAFLCVVLLSLVLVRSATRRFAARRDPVLELVARAVLVGLVGMLSAFVFLSGEYEKQLWLLLGFAAALSGLSRRRPSGERVAGAHADASP